jgi:hypothetical protein
MIAVTHSINGAARTVRTSVNLRFSSRSGAFQKIEVAALIRLRDMALIERAIAAFVARLGFFPRRAAS